MSIRGICWGQELLINRYRNNGLIIVSIVYVNNYSPAPASSNTPSDTIAQIIDANFGSKSFETHCSIVWDLYFIGVCEMLYTNTGLKSFEASIVRERAYVPWCVWAKEKNFFPPFGMNQLRFVQRGRMQQRDWVARSYDACHLQHSWNRMQGDGPDVYDNKDCIFESIMLWKKKTSMRVSRSLSLLRAVYMLLKYCRVRQLHLLNLDVTLFVHWYLSCCYSNIKERDFIYILDIFDIINWCIYS